MDQLHHETMVRTQCRRLWLVLLALLTQWQLVTILPAVAVDDTAVECYRRGKALIKTQKYSDAIHQFDQAIKIDPEEPAFWINRGICHSQLKQYQSSIDDYGRALAIKPSIATAYNNRGAVYLYLGKYLEAQSDFDKAIRYDAHYPNAYSNRGFTKIKLGRYKESLDDVNIAIKLKPDFAGAYTNLSMAQTYLDHYAEAIEACNQAIKLNPTMSSAYNNRAAIRVIQGDFTKSLDDFDQALKISPNDLEARNNRAAVYLTMGRTSDAVKDLQKALDSGIWDQPAAATTVIFCCVGLLKLHNLEAIKQLKEESDKSIKEKVWPHPIIQYLGGATTADELLALADNKSKQTEAECFIGMRLSSEGDDEKALEHFKVALNSEDKTLSEYNLAKAEVERIQKEQSK